jgi:phosphatidylserine decarboxylase
MFQSFISFLCPIHPEGVIFVALFAAVAAIAYWIYPPLGVIAWGLTAWCAYFFRDPRRMTPTREGLVISPADGLIQSIGPVVPPEEMELGEAPLTRISIFMNVFDVHVNRLPCDGRISKIHYYPGKFFNATLDKASEHNERQAFTLETSQGTKIGFVQIAGLIARRIRCDITVGKVGVAGERFGMIRFGSRVDVYLPTSVNPLVIVGQRAISGETVLADLQSAEPPRQGRRA